MSSLDYSELSESIESTKEHINWLEVNIIFSVLNTLKDDEIRLTKCIDDIEGFHRDMFVLPNKENKPADTEIAPAMKDDMNETKYSGTEPECSRNEPMYSMNEPACSMFKKKSSRRSFILKIPKSIVNNSLPWMNEPDCSMNKQKSSSRSLILKIPKSIVNNMLPSMNEADDSYGSRFSNNESSDGKNELSYDMDESGDGKNELSYDMDESGDGKNELSYDMEESGDGKDELSYDMDESGDGKDESSYDMDKSGDVKAESSDAEIEMAKKVLLNLLADKEKEITELVLHLINTFSCFQRRLRTADSVYPSTKCFPSESNVNVKRMLKDLSGSVLYLDKTVSNIYAKYSEMIESLGKIF